MQNCSAFWSFLDPYFFFLLVLAVSVSHKLNQYELPRVQAPDQTHLLPANFMLMSGRTYDCLRHDGTVGIR
jgi:hypothetical protein